MLDDQIPLQAVYPIRFEMFVKGKTHVITTQARAAYGVFANNGGFRVGFEFKEADPQRSALVKSLAGKKPMVDAPPANGPEQSAEMPESDANAFS